MQFTPKNKKNKTSETTVDELRTLGDLSKLPREILLSTMSFFTPAELAKTKSVNKTWVKLTNDENFLKSKRKDVDIFELSNFMIKPDKKTGIPDNTTSINVNGDICIYLLEGTGIEPDPDGYVALSHKLLHELYKLNQRVKALADDPNKLEAEVNRLIEDANGSTYEQDIKMAFLISAYLYKKIPVKENAAHPITDLILTYPGIASYCISSYKIMQHIVNLELSVNTNDRPSESVKNTLAYQLFLFCSNNQLDSEKRECINADIVQNSALIEYYQLSIECSDLPADSKNIFTPGGLSIKSIETLGHSVTNLAQHMIAKRMTENDGQNLIGSYRDDLEQNALLRKHRNELVTLYKEIQKDKSISQSSTTTFNP